jgi:FMN phosphatase YigB (HAD superfamily)
MSRGCVFTIQVGDVLLDLGILRYLYPVVISETERVEKPSMSIFLAACARAGATPSETVHIGDDFGE